MYFSLRLSLLVLACCFLGASTESITSPNRVGKDFALFFAVDTYDDPGWTDLKNPVRDAEAIAEELEKNFAFQTEVHRNPDLNKIQEVIIQWQNETFEKDAQLFVFFSGHGTVSDFDDEGYFMPADAETNNRNQLSLRSVRQAIGRIPCEHILIAVDACFSGTILEKGKAVPKRLGNSSKIERLRTITTELVYPSRFILTSGGRERVPDGDDHSPFTEGILNIFSNSLRTDGLITWEDLVSQLREEVKNPRPRYGPFDGHLSGGGFVFIRSDFHFPAIPQTRVKPEVILDQISLPKMIKIPGGSFSMGSNDENAHSDEKPIHKVDISSFYLSESEVTNAQYCAVLNALGNQEEGEGIWLNMDSSFVLIEERDEGFVAKPGYENHPVTGVSWYGARAYCNWLSEISGEDYRLPTEAEWEYAAGGGATNRTKWAGTDFELELQYYANYNGTIGLEKYLKTAPVKSFRPNRLGLYDMSGNVWEWCADYHHEIFYQYCVDKEIISNPIDTIPGDFFVIRGGDWESERDRGVSYRNYNYPNNGFDGSGFRIAKTLP